MLLLILNTVSCYNILMLVFLFTIFSIHATEFYYQDNYDDYTLEIVAYEYGVEYSEVSVTEHGPTPRTYEETKLAIEEMGQRARRQIDREHVCGE